MPQFVLTVGCLVSCAALAQGHLAAACFLLAWHVVLARAAQPPPRWS